MSLVGELAGLLRFLTMETRARLKEDMKERVWAMKDIIRRGGMLFVNSRLVKGVSD